CKTKPGGKGRQRNSIFARKIAIEDSNTVRGRRIVIDEVSWYHVSCESCRRRARGRGHLGIRHQVAWPDVREVAVLIAECSVVLPPQTQIQSQTRANLEIILEKGIHVRHAVPMDDPIRSATNAEQAKEHIARRPPIRAARVCRRAGSIGRRTTTTSDKE